MGNMSAFPPHTVLREVDEAPITADVALISLKAFGDFIVARWALRQAGDGTGRVALLAGDHLLELDQALGAAGPALHVLRHGESRVPAVFDVKKCGLRLAVSSALRLRRQIGALKLPSQTELIFDRVGMRERFVAGDSPARALPQASNIYQAYSTLLGVSESCKGRPLAVQPDGMAERVAIFPGSRIAAKALPARTIAKVVDACRHSGKAPAVFLLEGEPSDLAAGFPDVTVLPRRFDSMAKAVRSAGAVISADSMPAHMAEYFGQPVFVVSPAPNPYWLPLSCVAPQRWALFEEAATGLDRLDRFLACAHGSP